MKTHQRRLKILRYFTANHRVWQCATCSPQMSRKMLNSKVNKSLALSLSEKLHDAPYYLEMHKSYKNVAKLRLYKIGL